MDAQHNEGFGKARWARLLLAAVGVSLIEMGVLAGTGQRGSFALAAQVTALPPVGLFHDLRWLYVFHYSWGSFVWELACLAAFRTPLTALLVWLAWPNSLAPPDRRGLIGRAAVFNAIGFLVLSPFILLLFAAGATALAWPWFACIIPVFALSLVMHPWVITGRWGLLPTLSSCGWVLLTWLALTLAGAALELVPAWAAFPMVAVFGAFNAAAWRAVTGIFAGKTSPSFRLFAPGSILVVYAGLLAAFYLFLSGGRADGKRNLTGPYRSQSAQDSGIPLLIAEGLGTSWSGGLVPDFGERFNEVIFSYRGLNAQGEPLPYTAADTREHLVDVVKSLEKQVQALARKSGQPIRIICSSEGALATQIYLATHPEAPVEQVVISSPEIAPAQVYFPPEGEAGWGRISGLGVHGWLRLFELFGWQRPSQLPVLRSMLEHGPIVGHLDRCRMGEFKETVLMPLSSTVVMPWDLSTALPTFLVGTTHGHVVSEKQGNAAARAVLAGAAPQIPFWRTLAGWGGRALGSAWRMPPLPRSLPPNWKAIAMGNKEPDCPTTVRLLRQAFGEAVR